jgi:hypothetical protein
MIMIGSKNVDSGSMFMVANPAGGARRRSASQQTQTSEMIHCGAARSEYVFKLRFGLSLSVAGSILVDHGERGS